MPHPFLIHLALFVVTSIYGATFVVAKGIMPDLIHPFAFILLRVCLAFMCIFAVQRIFIKERVKAWKDLGHLALCAFLGVAANMLMFFKGLSMTSPINASLIMTITPIVVFIFAVILLKEKAPKLKITGVLMGFAGAAALILMPAESTGSKVISSHWGDALVFLNAVSYGLYLVVVKPLMQKYHPLTVITYTFLFGSLMVIPFGWSHLQEVDWPAFETADFAALAFVVLGTTFLAYLLNAWALKYVKSSVVGSYIYFQPLIASFLAVFIGDYQMKWWQIMFGLMIFSGVYLVNHSSMQQNRKLKQENA